MNAHRRREALLGWLRARPSGTAAQAAAHFEVTERTILRDIATLRDHGEPIISSPGPGGGFLLDSSARLPSVRLTLEEVIGLALATGMTQRVTTGIPFSRAANHALDRLIATLPRTRANAVRRILERIAVDAPANARVSTSLGSVEDGLLSTFEAAFSQNRVLSFEYIDRHQQHTSRDTEPHALLVQSPVWYIIAHDRLRDAPRIFRMDRMRNVTLHKDTFLPRPPSWFAEILDPCEAWPPHHSNGG